MLKADLHIHTRYSFDCNSPLEKIIKRCQEKGINCIAVADHGTVEGGLKMQEIAPFRVIVAQEILTTIGEIMGMFLTKSIPAGLDVEEAILRVREQGGLVNVPHPFDIVPRGGTGNHLTEKQLQKIDMFECFNARSPLPQGRVAAFAGKYGLGKTAGSDAHTIGEIGNAFVQMPDFKGKSDFLDALGQGTIFGKKASPFVHIGSVWARLKKPF